MRKKMLCRFQEDFHNLPSICTASHTLFLPWRSSADAGVSCLLTTMSMRVFSHTAFASTIFLPASHLSFLPHWGSADASFSCTLTTTTLMWVVSCMVFSSSTMITNVSHFSHSRSLYLESTVLSLLSVELTLNLNPDYWNPLQSLRFSEAGSGSVLSWLFQKDLGWPVKTQHAIYPYWVGIWPSNAHQKY